MISQLRGVTPSTNSIPQPHFSLQSLFSVLRLISLMNPPSPDLYYDSPRLVQVPGSFLRLKLPPALRPSLGRLAISPALGASKRIIPLPLAALLTDEKARLHLNERNQKREDERAKGNLTRMTGKVRFQDQRPAALATPPSNNSVIVHDTPKTASPPPLSRHLSPKLKPAKPLKRGESPSLQRWQERWEDKEQQALLLSIKELNELLAALRSRSKSPIRERGLETSFKSDMRLQRDRTRGRMQAPDL